MADAPVNIKTGSLSSQTIHTREKIGNLCKRLLCYIVENKKYRQSIKDIVPAIGGDVKKVVELVFILESIGLITRIQKNAFVYTGFQGMIQRLIEFAQQKQKKGKVQDQSFRLFSEDLNIGDKGVSIKSSIYLGKVISRIIYSALLEPNKTISRGEVEALFEEYSQHLKDSSSTSKNIVNDMINLLIALNLVEKNDSNDNLTWSGPDCINSAGVNNDNLNDIDNLYELLKPKNVNYDAKELAYFKNILKDEITNNRVNIKPEDFIKESKVEEYKKDPNSSLNLYPFSSFEQGGYALLKGKTWQYLMTKPSAIIGRAATKDSSKKYKWEVDVDLSNSPSISRQHAVILYNYEDECFEIKCLSKKNPVKVGEYSYDFKDKACPLESKTLITLGGECFFFYLPNISVDKPQDADQEKKEENDGEGGEDAIKDEEEKIKEEDDEEKIKVEDDGDEFESGKGNAKSKGDMEEEDDGDGDNDGEGEGDGEDDDDDAMEIEGE